VACTNGPPASSRPASGMAVVLSVVGAWPSVSVSLAGWLEEPLHAEEPPVKAAAIPRPERVASVEKRGETRM